MESAARCLTALLTLKATLRVLGHTMSTGGGGGGRPPVSHTRRTTRKSTIAGSDNDSDVELLWSELDAAESLRPRHSPNKKSSIRLEKAKLFLRKTQQQTSKNCPLTMSPQRNYFRVTDLHVIPPPLPPTTPTAAAADIPLPPPDDSDSVDVAIEQQQTAVANLNIASLQSSPYNTSAFLAARTQVLLQEARRNSSSNSRNSSSDSRNSRGCRSKSVTLTVTVTKSEDEEEEVRRIEEKEVRRIEEKEVPVVNRLQEVRTWAHTGLGQRLLDNPSSRVGIAIFLTGRKK